MIVPSSNHRSHRRLAAGLAPRLPPLLALFITPAAPPPQGRTRSSASGAHKTEAELVELKDDGTVVLKTQAGKTVSLPMSRLSEADQAYVRAHAAAKSPKEKTKATKSLDEVEAEAAQCRTAKNA